MKIYDEVKQMLEQYPYTRNSDKILIWRIWMARGYCGPGDIKYSQFLSSPSPESITRARRKVQELNPGLAAAPEVEQERSNKAAQKGMFVFHDES